MRYPRARPFAALMTMPYAWKWTLAAPPAVVWPYLRDTERVNKAAGLQIVQFEDQPLPEGGVCRTGRFSYLGMDVEWDERPFEWVAGAWISVERVYRKGPMRRMVVDYRLHGEGNGSCIAIGLDVQARGAWAWPVIHGQLLGLVKPGFHRAFSHLDAHLQGRTRYPWPDDPPRLLPDAEPRAAATRKALIADGLPAELADRIVTYVLQRPDRDVARMRPYAEAESLGVPRATALRAFLVAADTGLVDLLWDVKCPHCRGGQRVKSLAGVRTLNVCLSCNLEYTARFDREVEVTFTPHRAVRALDLSEHCVGGPGKVPHVYLQRRVPARGQAQFTLDVPAGRWRMRSPLTSASATFDVQPGQDGVATTTVEIDAEGVTAGGPLRSGMPLTVNNHTDYEQLLSIDDPADDDFAASGADVSALQAFRTRFVREVMPPDQQLAVHRMVFFFTDLCNSTAMYERSGDGAALQRVRRHFDVLFRAVEHHNGAVVKTVGDAMMAVFRAPVDALQAGEAMVRAVAAIPGPGEPLVLRVGVHVGPCLAVNLDERLDYFGSTVNRAARIECCSAGNDVVCSADVTDDEAAAAFLAQRRTERFTTELRGMLQPVELVRLLIDGIASPTSA
jgi:class 3 adenylate cyclase